MVVYPGDGITSQLAPSKSPNVPPTPPPTPFPSIAKCTSYVGSNQPVNGSSSFNANFCSSKSADPVANYGIVPTVALVPLTYIP
jgi:hypothetical protein